MQGKKGFFKSVDYFFDKLEDHIRGWLSRRPLLYTLIGSLAIVLFWRGIWHTADQIPFLTGPVSLIIGGVVLLMTGLFVSAFVGDFILMSGFKKEERKVQKESTDILRIENTLQRIEEELGHIHKSHIEK